MHFKKKFIPVLLFLLFAGTLYSIYEFGIKATYEDLIAEKEEEFRRQENIVIAPPPEPVKMFGFGKPFHVNLADKKKNHSVHFVMSLGYDKNNSALGEELLFLKDNLESIIKIVAGEKYKKDLESAMQKINMFEEMKSLINMILKSGKIIEVYFESFELK